MGGVRSQRLIVSHIQPRSIIMAIRIVTAAAAPTRHLRPGCVRFDDVKVRPNRVGTSQCKFMETALRFHPVEDSCSYGGPRMSVAGRR